MFLFSEVFSIGFDISSTSFSHSILFPYCRLSTCQVGAPFFRKWRITLCIHIVYNLNTFVKHIL